MRLFERSPQPSTDRNVEPISDRDADRLRQAATTCALCGDRQWWRLEPAWPWVCETCHPPAGKAVERTGAMPSVG
jgi:hypothetical protein